MYVGSKSRVKVGGERSRSGKKIDLRQVSTFSPLSFIIGMDEVMAEVSGKIGEEKVKVMIFDGMRSE